MVSSKVISRRSAFKSLFIISVIPGLFITSCTKDASLSVNPEKTSQLYKSDMDLELESAEKFVVRNVGEIEIQKKFIFNGPSKSYILILIRGKQEFFLKQIPIEIKSTKRNTVIIENINIGSILLANQAKLIKSLFNLDKERLNEKFKGGKNFYFGGN